jgi:hypothetical protein
MQVRFYVSRTLHNPETAYILLHISHFLLLVSFQTAWQVFQSFSVYVVSVMAMVKPSGCLLKRHNIKM